MNARDSLLVALPALLVGVGAGYQLESFLGGTSSAIEASAPGPRGAPTETLQPDGREQAPLLAPPTGTTRASTPEESAAKFRVSEPELERALADVSAPRVEAKVGEGAITGKVQDEEGAPVANVTIIGVRRSTVLRTSDPKTVGGGPPSDNSLKKFLRERADAWAAERAQRRRVTTGPDGAFVLDGLDDASSYGVTAYREGYVVEATERAYEVAVGQKVTFRARKVHEIPVELVCEDDSEIVDAVVTVERGNQTTHYDWSTAEPVLRLVPGRVGLTGYAGARNSAANRNEVDSSHRSEKLSLDVIENAGAPVRLVLKARAGVRGQVADAWGSSSAHEVKCMLLGSDGALDEKLLAKSNQESRVRGGRYSLLDLTPGRYAIGVTYRNSDSLLMHEIVDIAAGVVELDLEVPEPNADEHLIVRAAGPNGRPLEELSFDFMYQSGNGSSSGGAQARRAPDGAYWLAFGSRYGDFFAPWPEETSYTLTVQHSQLGNRVIKLEEGRNEIDVRFTEPVSIVVLVSGLAGSGQEGKVRANVERVEEGEESDDIGRMYRGGRRRNDGNLSPEGKARFDGLAPGLWKVGLVATDDYFGGDMIVSQEVRALSGEVTVNLAVPALHSLSIHAPGLAVGAWLSLRDADDKGANVWRGGKNGNLDKDHRVTFDGLVAGEYLLGGNGVNEEVRVTVPGGEFLLDVKEPDCMRVSIGDMEGEMYKAGLRAGDLVVGVDGKDLASAQDVWKLYRESKGETVTFSVLRGTERLEFALPILAMSGNWYAKLGGMLTPASRE